MPRHRAVMGEGAASPAPPTWDSLASGLPELGRKAWLLLADKIADDRDVLRFPPLSRPTFSLEDVAEPI